METATDFMNKILITKTLGSDNIRFGMIFINLAVNTGKVGKGQIWKILNVDFVFLTRMMVQWLQHLPSKCEDLGLVS